MGYFDGLVAGSFKHDAQGREIFFLRGIFGKGRIVPNEDDGTWVRRYLKIYYLCTILGLIPIGWIAGGSFGLRWWLTIGAYGALVGIAVWPLRRRIRHWELANERLTLKEELTASAKANSAASLWVWILISLLLVAVGILSLIYAQDSMLGLWGPIILIVFFGGWLGVLMWMLSTRRRR